MRLCDVAGFFSDRGGGVRTYHLQKQAYFARHPEHDYTMIVPAASNAEERVAGCRVRRVRGVLVSPRGGYRQIVDYPALRRALAEAAPEVVEVGTAYVDPWFVLSALRGSDAATVGFYHADFPDTYVAPALSRAPAALRGPVVDLAARYARFVYRRFDAVCVTSRAVETKLRRAGLDNTLLVPLGVDAELFHPSKRSEPFRRELGLGPSDCLLLYVGRFWTEKGIDVLLDVLPGLVEAEGRLHVVFVGDGTRAAEVRRLARLCPRTWVLDFVHDRERLARIYASADLFVSPGPYETFGLSSLEAMSAGLPVVGAAAGGTGEIVSASGAGCLFEPGDRAALRARVLELLRSDLAARGRAARRFVEAGYGWDRTFDRMVDLYGALLEEKRASAGLAPRRDPGVGPGGPGGPAVRPGLGPRAAGPARSARPPSALAPR